MCFPVTVDSKLFTNKEKDKEANDRVPDSESREKGKGSAARWEQFFHCFRSCLFQLYKETENSVSKAVKRARWYARHHWNCHLKKKETMRCPANVLHVENVQNGVREEMQNDRFRENT